MIDSMRNRERWRASAGALARQVARAAGQDLVTRNYYSPIPDLESVPSDVFERRSRLTAIDFDTDAQLAVLESLEPFLAEFEPPAGWGWGRETYGPVEADVLHAIIRRHRPHRIIELGSGFSSLIIADAARRNAADGSPVSYTAFDPFARNFIRAGVEGLELVARSATEVPSEDLEALGDGDILFVDTTHTVKLASEVNHVILDVLPALAPGVIVHVHDIYLPFEYPRQFFEQRCFWAEQYLLQAFLTQNPNWDILLPLYSLVRERPAEVSSLVRTFEPAAGPGAFWMRRRHAQGEP
jgi:predicted O-methyltransferase YrrM